MFQRIIGVFKLNAATFNEIEQDKTATTQAALIVILVALLEVLSVILAVVVLDRIIPGTMEELESGLSQDLALNSLPQMNLIGTGIFAGISAILAWPIWSLLTYFIGTKLFGGTADIGEMLRVIGFAQAPRLLAVFFFIPCIGTVLDLASTIWVLAASFVGIREGLDLGNGRTLLTIIVSFIGVLIVNYLFGLVLAQIFAL